MVNFELNPPSILNLSVSGQVGAPLTYTFPRDGSVQDYVTYERAVPQMEDFTICMYLTPKAIVDATLVSYARGSKEEADIDNTILFQIRSTTNMDIWINGQNNQLDGFNFQKDVEV